MSGKDEMKPSGIGTFVAFILAAVFLSAITVHSLGTGELMSWETLSNIHLSILPYLVVLFVSSAILAILEKLHEEQGAL